MKIIEFKAENVKRLKAVEITPDGTLQVIGGRNAQGKSSVLDAIWLALGGAKATKDTSRPIRDGEESAWVTVDMGRIVVTRTWDDKGNKVQVKGADGAIHAAPQRLLDRLLGHLSFDPVAFTRLSAKEQREALLDLVELDVDLDELDSDRARLYDERTEAGRRDKDLGDITVDHSLPAEQQSPRDLISEIRHAEDHNREVLNARGQSAQLTERIATLEAELAEAKAALAAAKQTASRELVDTSELEQQLATVEETNAAIRANEEAKARKAQRAELKTERDKRTREITAIDTAKAKALRTAKFPVPGLGFDAHGVTYNERPFSQASSAEQIRVSVGMGMAMNPDLRVMFIRDGSLLDDEAMVALREQIEEHDFQLWIERVGNADETAVIIEDGQVQA